MLNQKGNLTKGSSGFAKRCAFRNRAEPSRYDRNMMKLRKPGICPICSRSNIKRIVGGIPDEVGMSLIEVGEAVAGDCFMRDWKEDWLCTDCGHRWCDKTDPARIELEELYMKLKNKLEKS